MREVCWKPLIETLIEEEQLAYKVGTKKGKLTLNIIYIRILVEIIEKPNEI